MEFREVARPSAKVQQQVIGECQKLVVSGKPTYRHFVMMTLWHTLQLTDWRVPIGIQWPFGLLNEDSLDKRMEALRDSFRIIWLMTQARTNNDRVAAASFSGEVATAWMCLRSTEISDTPNWYRPSEDLLYTLAATNLTGVYAEDVRLPFPAIWLEIPRGTLRSRSQRGLHDVLCIGLSIACCELLSYDDIYKEDRKKKVDQYGKHLLMIFCQEPLPGDVGLDDISGQAGVIQLNDNERALHEISEENRISAEPQWLEEGDQIEVFGQPSGTLRGNRKIFNMVIGFLLYLTQTKDVVQRGGSFKQRGRDRKGTQEARNLLASKTWLVGTRCRIDPEIKRAVRSGESLDYRHKTVVPGHAQRYRCGPREDWHYEVRFKAPYVKGGDGPILGHSYG